MQTLKLHLQKLGPLRPAAWAHIAEKIVSLQLKENESLIREAGTIAFVSDGLLKEYNPYERTKPSIVNFICAHQYIVNRRHNQGHFIRACCPSMVYSLAWPAIADLFHRYPELKQIHDGIGEQYDIALFYRQLVLEERLAANRISLFIQKNRSILPRLKKKDIANYLHLDYDHFVRHYSKLL